MSHKDGNFKHALRRGLKPYGRKPNISGRAFNGLKRNSAQDFSHQVRKFPREAAQLEKTFEHATRLIEKGHHELSVEAIDYLLEHEGKFVTYNKSYGRALAALANHGQAPKAISLLRTSINGYPENMAANSSIGQAFDALLATGHGRKVANMMFALCTQAPELIAKNPESGRTLRQLFDHGHEETAANAFIVVATHRPNSFAQNSTVQKVIEGLRGHDFSQTFGADKSNLVHRLCDKMVELRTIRSTVTGQSPTR